jgi:hypothetical protein
MRLKQAGNLFVVSSQLVKQQEEVLDQCQHQAGLGPCGDSIRLQGWLLQLLPNTLADAAKAPVLCLLENQEQVFQGGLCCGLRCRVGLKEGQSRRPLE